MRYVRPSASNAEILIVSRFIVVALGAWALYQSLGTTSVLKQSLYAYTIYSAALTPVSLAAFSWRRATAAGAVSSIAAGTIVTILWDKPFVSQNLPAAIAARDAILPALIVSLICLCLVSVLTPRPTEAQLHARSLSKIFAGPFLFSGQPASNGQAKLPPEESLTHV